jgi:predicted dehydrogenase
MKRNVSIGVVGLGYWGPNIARNFAQLEGCRVKGLCDLDEKRLQRVSQLLPDTPCFEDLDDMLASSDLEAVAIATPVNQHYLLAKKALSAGKHVLVEKPLASSSEECSELIQLAASKGLTLMVGHTYLYSAPVRMIAEFIKSGELGDICYINSRRLNLGLFQRDINVTWDLAPHDLSIIMHLLEQSPSRVNCQGNAHVTSGVEDVSNLSLRFPEGQFATVQSSWIEPRKVREMTIVGTRKMIVYNDIEPMEKLRIYDSRVESPPHYDSFGEFQYAYHYGDSFLPRIEQREPLRQVCSHFIDCIVTGARPLSCGSRGLEVVRVLEACDESLAAGGAAIDLSQPAVRTSEKNPLPESKLNESGKPTRPATHIQ